MKAISATNPSWLIMLRFFLTFRLDLVDVACLGDFPGFAFRVGERMKLPLTLESMPDAPEITLPQL